LVDALLLMAWPGLARQVEAAGCLAESMETTVPALVRYVIGWMGVTGQRSYRR